MALIDCFECGQKISTEARACPNCGAPSHLRQSEKQMSGSGESQVFTFSNRKMAAIAIGTILVIALGYWIGGPGTVSTPVTSSMAAAESSERQRAQLPIVPQPRVARSCSTSEARAAAGKIEHDMRVMIATTPIVCTSAREASKQCSIICISEYEVGETQRSQNLIWLMGVAGIEINRRGPAKFSNVVYSDRTLLLADSAYWADAGTLADLQKYIHDTDTPALAIEGWAAALFTKKHFARPASHAR